MEKIEEQIATSGNKITNIFQGYNTFYDEGCLHALTGVTESGAGSIETRCKVVTNFESFSSAINLSASASVSYLDIGGASDKATFTRDLSLTTYSISVIAYGHKVSENLSVKTVQFIEGVTPPTSDTLKSFYRKYGDSYISQIKKGAEYIGIYTFFAQTKEEQQSIQNTLSVNGIYDGIKFDSEIQNKLSQVRKNVNTRQSFSQILFGFNSMKLPDQNEIGKFLDNEFASTKPDAPTIISYSTSGYETVLDNDAFGSIEKTRQLFDGKFTSLTLAEVISNMAYLRNQVDFISSVYLTYGIDEGSDPKFFNNRTKIAEDWKTLSSLVTQIYDKPYERFTIPKLDSLTFGVPELTVRIEENAPWGGDSGAPFQDVTYMSVHSQTKISRIVMRGGAWVDCLEVTYVNAEGKKTVCTHGGNGGAESLPFNLQPRERIISIKGTATAERYIYQLEFKTNYNQQFKWPLKPDGAAKMFPPLELKDNQVILGFGGRAGKYLDQLQPIICTFIPAEWIKQ